MDRAAWGSTIAGQLVGPIDRLRVRALRGLGPVGRSLVADRELRVATGGSVAVLLALATTLTVPLWALALGPILLGVPHLCADVRYLVVRPGLHRRPAIWLGLGLPLAWGLLGGGAEAAVATVAGALVVARGSAGRRLVGLALVVPAWLLARAAGVLALVVLMHAHNFVAVAFWAAWRPRRRHLHWLPLVLFVLGVLALTTDAAVDLVTGLGGLGSPSLRRELARIAPGLAPAMATKLLLVFAYAQSVHYAVWLRLVPDEDRARPTTRSFRGSLAALRGDLGTIGLAVTSALALGVALWGAIDLWAARDGYFRLAMFHGPLELGAAALFWIEGLPERRDHR